MADEINPLRFSYYRVELEYFEAIRKHSISPALRKIRGRSAEDPRGSQGSEGTGWAPSRGTIDYPVRGRRAPGEIIDLILYLHRGRSAEDPRGSRSWIQKHTGPPASKFWPQATAQDSRKTPRKSFGATGSISSRGACLPALWYTVGFGWLHWVAGYRVATGWRATGWPPIPKKLFCLHRGRSAEDARKIRGRPPRKS